MLFKLNVLGENDVVVKTYETSKIKMGLLEDLMTLQEKISGKSLFEQFNLIKPLLFLIFPGLTNDELRNVDYVEVIGVINTLAQYAKTSFGTDEKN